MIQKTSKLKIYNFSFVLFHLSTSSASIMNDDRMPVINHLADDLHKRLNELENLYSTVNT